MADEAEPVVEETTKTDEVKVDAAAEPEVKPEGEETPKPGTPDKAMQKMQQELGNVTRQLAALTEKKAETGLSAADKAKLEKAQQRLQKIRQFVSRSDREDLPSDVDPVAETVLELTEKVSKQDKLEAELKEAREQIAYLMNDRGWEKVQVKYAGLDVNAIWDKALTDATETLGGEGTKKAVERLASKWFEERCDAAKKRLGEDPKRPAANNKTAPATFRVGSGDKAAPVLSDEDEALAMARQLVTET